MDVNVWLGGNNNIFSSVNKNIFSLSLAQWRVSSAHGCLIQVTKGVVWWHQQQPPWWPGATLGSQHQMQSSHFYITQTAFSLHNYIIEEIFIKYYSSDGGLWLVIHVMYPSKWCVEAWAAVSSELHCAESESGDTGAMVELVPVEPFCWTQHLFMTQLGSNWDCSSSCYVAGVLSPPRREDQIQILREYVWHQNKYWLTKWNGEKVDQGCVAQWLLLSPQSDQITAVTTAAVLLCCSCCCWLEPLISTRENNHQLWLTWKWKLG